MAEEKYERYLLKQYLSKHWLKLSIDLILPFFMALTVGQIFKIYFIVNHKGFKVYCIFYTVQFFNCLWGASNVYVQYICNLYASIKINTVKLTFMFYTFKMHLLFT